MARPFHTGFDTGARARTWSRVRTSSWASLIVVGAGCVDAPSPSSPDDTVTVLPIIDMHTHLHPTTEEINAKYIDDFVAAAVANGVAKVVIGLNARHKHHRPPMYTTEHDEWVLAVAENHPGVVIPALGGFDPTQPDAVLYVREQLETGQWGIIGELDVRNQFKETTVPANSDNLMQIYALAGAHGVPVLLHFDADYGTSASEGDAELNEALAEHPDTDFILAHGCGPTLVERIATYDNLYCEHKFGSIAAGIATDRVVLGTDMQIPFEDTEIAGENYAERIIGVRASIAEWDEPDQQLAATATPSRLLGF